MDAPAISHGTTASKTPGGVVSNTAAPAAPPSTLTTLSRRIERPWPRNSTWEPPIEPAVVATRATVLVTLAEVGDRPASSSAGYDASEARPPTAPSSPARIPAPTRSTNIHPLTVISGSRPGEPGTPAATGRPAPRRPERAAAAIAGSQGSSPALTKRSPSRAPPPMPTWNATT